MKYLIPLFLFVGIFSCSESDDCVCPDPETDDQQETDSVELTFQTAIIGEWEMKDVSVLDNQFSAILNFDSTTLSTDELQLITDSNLNHGESFSFENGYEMDEENRQLVTEYETFDIGFYDRDSIRLSYNAPFPKPTDEEMNIEFSLVKGVDSEF